MLLELKEKDIEVYIYQLVGDEVKVEKTSISKNKWAINKLNYLNQNSVNINIDKKFKYI